MHLLLEKGEAKSTSLGLHSSARKAAKLLGQQQLERKPTRWLLRLAVVADVVVRASGLGARLESRSRNVRTLDDQNDKWKEAFFVSV